MGKKSPRCRKKADTAVAQIAAALTALVDKMQKLMTADIPSPNKLFPGAVHAHRSGADAEHCTGWVFNKMTGQPQPWVEALSVPSARIPGRHFEAFPAEDTDTLHTVAMYLADDPYPNNTGVGITRELITENETTLNCIKEVDEVMKAYVKFCRELNRSALARSESLQSVEVKKIVSKLPREFVRHLHRYVFPDMYWGKAILNHCEWFTRREAFSLPLQQLTDAIYDQFKLKKKPDSNYPLSYM